jgi:hypothetical protein
VDRVAATIILDRGRIVFSGPSRDLLDAPDRLDALLVSARPLKGV